MVVKHVVNILKIYILLNNGVWRGCLQAKNQEVVCLILRLSENFYEYLKNLREREK